MNRGWGGGLLFVFRGDGSRAQKLENRWNCLNSFVRGCSKGEARETWPNNLQGRYQGTSRQAGFFLEIETQAKAEVEKPVHRLAEANSTTLGHTQVDV